MNTVSGTTSAFDPASGEPAWPEDAVEVGRIADAWGIKGAFKVQAFSADPQALFSSRRWFLQPALLKPGVPVRPVPASKSVAKSATGSASGATAAIPRLLRITQAREQGEWVVASAQEVADRTAAEALRGARVFISRSSFPTADSDEFYWVDLIGLIVFNRQGQALGEVVGLIETGPHCVLRIRPAEVPAGETVAAESERLVPFVSAFVDAVDMPGRKILVDWGLDF